MKTVIKKTSSKFRDKGSKFLGYLFPCSSAEEFDDQLGRIKSKYPDATHHCYAWRIDPNDIEEFAQDDGEPGGTAGLPILNKLKSSDVVNAGCIVVRYYGGTNLGKSGLIQAYGHTAQLCIEKTSLATLIPTKNFRITYPYAQQSQINQLKNQFDLKEIEAEYLEQVKLNIACRSEQAQEFGAALQQLMHKGVESEQMGDGFVTMKA